MSSSVLLGLLLATTAGPPDPAVVAKAEALLRAADQKLASANTLHAVYTETDQYPGDYRDLRQIGTLDVAKPGNLRLQIVRSRRVKASDPWRDSGNTTLRVSDGSTEYDVFFHTNSTQVRSTAPQGSPKLPEAPLLSGFFGSKGTPATEFTKAADGGDVASAEVNGSVIKYTTSGQQKTIEIGEDGLVHRVESRNEASGNQRTWTLDVVTINQTVATSFTYDPPKDALPYPTAERSVGVLVGTDAPDFADSTASNESIHLSDLKGHVVLLEFWATWCWPCNQSIPETQRLTRAYQSRGVKSLLVSIKDSKKGFDAWIGKHPQYKDLTFAFDDPVHGAAYEAFLHPQNPTLYVIGKDGKVQAKFEGYTGPNPKVEAAIESALGR